MAPRTQTQSIESDLAPDAIFQVLSDPANLPQWAPAFADKVACSPQNQCQITKGSSTFLIEVIAIPATRTVDYLREIAPGKKGGASARVLPRPDGGSVTVMTLPIPSGVDPQAVASTLTAELHALIRLTERAQAA